MFYMYTFALVGNEKGSPTKGKIVESCGWRIVRLIHMVIIPE